MERDEIIKRIDIITRGLSQPSNETDESSEINIVRKEVEEEDKPKLAALLEDLIVMLKDDPENRAKIKEIWGRLMDGYGHIKPVSEVLGSVKLSFLDQRN
ncbi:MAG TPA: hypothetical protein VFJ51_05030 [Nitrososphaeraceae archaeon]|jgi:hypothetical protein|nr:hypothetical protein [Nitrososphaeraceae archaeon]